jgi:hypothetical protein
MPRWLLAVAALTCLYVAYDTARSWPTGGVAAPPVVLGPEPVQEALDPVIPKQVHRGDRTFFLLQTHRYAVTGQVLSAHAYDLAWTNDFFDVDLGLAWGDQVDRLTRTYTFYQDARWLFWRSDTPVADDERMYITTHVGNVHTIPADGNDRIARALRSVRAGDRVALDGKLVTIEDAATNVLSRSSTSRSDTGAGACEILYVERLQIGDLLYR